MRASGEAGPAEVDEPGKTDPVDPVVGRLVHRLIQRAAETPSDVSAPPTRDRHARAPELHSGTTSSHRELRILNANRDNKFTFPKYTRESL